MSLIFCVCTFRTQLNIVVVKTRQHVAVSEIKTLFLGVLELSNEGDPPKIQQQMFHWSDPAMCRELQEINNTIHTLLYNYDIFMSKFLGFKMFFHRGADWIQSNR